MDDDTCPRLAPPPRPTLLEMSNPKPVVPEVSLLSYNDDSYTWQASRQNINPSRQQAMQGDHKWEGIQACERGHNARAQGLTAAEYLADNPQATQAHALPSPRFSISRSFDREKYKLATVPLSDRTRNKFPSEKQYNPQVYSPVPKQPSISSVVAETPPLYHKDYHLARQAGSIQQHCTSKTAGNIISLKVKPVQHTVTSLQINSQHTTPPVTSKPGVPQGRSPYTVMESGTISGHKPNDFHTSAHRFNKENINPSSSPVVQMSRLHPSSEACDQVIYVNNKESVYPVTAVHPLQFSQKTPNMQNAKSNSSTSLGWKNTELVNQSPDAVGDRISTSLDHLVYQLLADQTQQINNLSKTIEKLMEGQQEVDSIAMPKKEQSEKIIYARGAAGNTTVQKDTSTQTVTPGLTETRSVGVNTDICWPECFAVINSGHMHDPNDDVGLCPQRRVGSNIVEHLEATKRGNDHQFRQKRALHCQSVSQEDIPNSLEQEGRVFVYQDTSIISQKVQPLLPAHVSSSVENPAPYVFRSSRDSENHENILERPDSLLLGESASSYPINQPDSPNTPPPGFTFYNNVMTNIQHILQNSDTAQVEEQEQQQYHHHHNQQQQQAHNELPLQTERPQVDPQVEAMRKQLMQLGISFMDPTTLNNNRQAIVDTMYLPGLHNIVSLYQSAVSTHYHPAHPRLDDTTAKYLTDPQLADIAAKSSVMVRSDEGRRARNFSPEGPISSQETLGHLYKFTVSNNVSMSTINFLEKYGIKED